MGRRKGFWGKFDDLFESLPEYIDGEIKAAENSVNTIGNNNVVINGSSIVKQRTVFGSSTSTINQGGKKIVVKTKNNKTTISVNGKEVYKEN